MTVQTYAVVRGILGFIFTLLIIATAYCYHDWVQVAFLFSMSVILYLILFAGVFVDTVLDMTRERTVSYTHLAQRIMSCIFLILAGCTQRPVAFLLALGTSGTLNKSL